MQGFLRGLLAVAHKKRHGPRHRIWCEEMIWSGGRAWVWFCTCRKAWWPSTAPFGPAGDTIDREPPWERKW